MKNLEKYFVIATKYVSYLSVEERKQLKNILETIQGIRETTGKDRYPNYIVCKDSEPYADDVWKLILNNESEMDKKMLEAHYELDELKDLEDFESAAKGFTDANL